MPRSALPDLPLPPHRAIRAIRHRIALAGAVALLAAACATPSRPASAPVSPPVSVPTPVPPSVHEPARTTRAVGDTGERPPVWPVRRYVANIDVTAGFRISPDGRRTASSETVGLGAGTVIRDAANGSVLSRLPIAGGATWLGDGRHLVQAFDPLGDENLRVRVYDSGTPDGAPWVATPWPGARSVVVGRGTTDTTFRFVSNRRDRKVFDLYEADAATRRLHLLRQADTRTRAWLIDVRGEIVGQARRVGDPDAEGSEVAFELEQPDGTRRTLRTVGPFDTWALHRIDLGLRRAWVSTNVDRDRIELAELDLDTGTERVLGAHPVVDIDGPVFIDRYGPPIGWTSMDGLPRLHAIDADAASPLARLGDRAWRDGLLDDAPVIVMPQGRSEDGRRWIVTAIGRLDRAELLWDRETDTLRRLDRRDTDAAFRASLSPWEPVSFDASDGRRLHGLLLRPRGHVGPVPTIVDIHGGPWSRDRWGPATPGLLQMLANRGYAVLQVNFRGSHGYGREHLWAGARTYGDRLQRDIADAVQWAIDAGIADRERLAVLGASFGGYSAMMQLITQPHPYRCGVSIVGVADWPRTIAAWPPYWTNRSWATRFYGRLDDPAERAEMLRQSPVSALDRIAAPLLVVHGERDVRVLQQDSVDVVRSLRARGHPVRYLSFPDAGHAIVGWRNRLTLGRELEDHFARCLGGARAGFDLYEWVPSRVRRDPE